MRFQRKDTEQVHVCLGALGLPRHDERRFALRVLDAMFGGLSSSRLFQAVREERGLAYAVYSFSGQFSTPARSASTWARARTTSARRWSRRRTSSSACARTATEEELERARENVKARIVLGLESSGARMNRLGSSTLFGLPLLETDELMARIDAVTLDDLRALVDELWAPEALSAAGIGPDEDAFPPPSPASARPRSRSRRDPGRRRRRRGAHGADGVRGGRGRRRPRAERARRPGARTSRSADVLDGADVVVDFTQPDQALANAGRAWRRASTS